MITVTMDTRTALVIANALRSRMRLLGWTKEDYNRCKRVADELEVGILQNQHPELIPDEQIPEKKAGRKTTGSGA